MHFRVGQEELQNSINGPNNKAEDNAVSAVFLGSFSFSDCFLIMSCCIEAVDFAGLDNGNNAKRKAATHGCEDGKCKVVVGFRHRRCGFLACGFYFIFDLSFLLRCEILLVELFVVHVFNVVGDCCYTSMCMSPLSAHAAFLFVYRAFVFCFLARWSYLV